jgi:hypothetical protein
MGFTGETAKRECEASCEGGSCGEWDTSGCSVSTECIPGEIKTSGTGSFNLSITGLANGNSCYQNNTTLSVCQKCDEDGYWSKASSLSNCNGQLVTFNCSACASINGGSFDVVVDGKVNLAPDSIIGEFPCCDFGGDGDIFVCDINGYARIKKCYSNGWGSWENVANYSECICPCSQINYNKGAGDPNCGEGCMITLVSFPHATWMDALNKEYKIKVSLSCPNNVNPDITSIEVKFKITAQGGVRSGFDYRSPCYFSHQFTPRMGSYEEIIHELITCVDPISNINGDNPEGSRINIESVSSIFGERCNNLLIAPFWSGNNIQRPGVDFTDGATPR